MTHPSFKRAAALSEPLRSHFPKTAEEAAAFEPLIRRTALARQVLAVAQTRVECAWSAYIDAVPGLNHSKEMAPILDRGAKLHEALARLLFPEFWEVPYAE